MYEGTIEFLKDLAKCKASPSDLNDYARMLDQAERMLPSWRLLIEYALRYKWLPEEALGGLAERSPWLVRFSHDHRAPYGQRRGFLRIPDGKEELVNMWCKHVRILPPEQLVPLTPTELTSERVFSGIRYQCTTMRFDAVKIAPISWRYDLPPGPIDVWCKKNGGPTLVLVLFPLKNPELAQPVHLRAPLFYKTFGKDTAASIIKHATWKTGE